MRLDDVEEQFNKMFSQGGYRRKEVIVMCAGKGEGKSMLDPSNDNNQQEKSLTSPYGGQNETQR